MKEIIEFKSKLKKIQSDLRTRLKGLQKEVEEVKNKRYTKELFVKDCIDGKYPNLASDLEVYIATARSLKIDFKTMHEQFDVDIFCDGSLKTSYANYNIFQQVINNMDNDKIINYINLSVLLEALAYVETPYRDACKIFGMVVNFDSQLIKKSTKIDEEEKLDIYSLEKYFNADGSFKLNTDELWFYGILNKLIQDYLWGFKTAVKYDLVEQELSDRMNKRLKGMIKSFADFLNESNEQLMDSIDTNEISDKKANLKFDKKANFVKDERDELKKYYKNGELIEVPEDISLFHELLDKCELDINERKYILGLVNEELKRINTNRILKYLDASDKKTYKKAIDVLDRMKYTDVNYYPIIQVVEDLKVAGEMLEDTINEEEKSYILEEISGLMSSLTDLLPQEEKVSENNIVFLCNEFDVPYLKEDTDNLDGSFAKMVQNGIRKIRKENQGSFKLLMTREKLPYRVYYVLSSKVTIFFVEVDEGIYMIAGTFVNGQGFDIITTRVVGKINEIVNMSTMIKDEKERNLILKKNENYFELFNTQDINDVRKRKNDK